MIKSSAVRREANQVFTLGAKAVDEQLLSELQHAAKCPVSRPNVHHLVRTLSGQSFSVETVPDIMLRFHFLLRWECFRAARHLGHDLQSLIDVGIANETGLYQHLSKIDSTTPFQRTPARVWEAQRTKGTAYTLKGNITVNKESSDTMFSIHLQPIQSDNTSRLQRKFGCERFLYLDLPSLYRGLPTAFKGGESKDVLRENFRDWLLDEKHFLGCKWKFIYIQPIKPKRGASKKPEFDKRAIFFATEWPGLETIPVELLLDWAVSLSRNSLQPHCKAYTRLELSLSQTIPTVTFEPSEVRMVSDIKADGSLGSAEYLAFGDPAFAWDITYNSSNQPDMTDGCEIISTGAAAELCEKLGLKGHRPVTFQARINGCKGMWTISAPYDSKNPFHRSRWIEIRQSQRKVIPPTEDLHDLACEEGRWTFELVKANGPCRASSLHMDFIPILEDRGVPRKILHHIVSTQLEEDFEELLESMEDSVALRGWLSSKYSMVENDAHGNGIEWEAGFPRFACDKAIYLLESGFDASRSAYLASQMQVVSMRWLEKTREKLRVRIGRSTSVYGIADHTGTLQEGEIHLSFSETFHDDATGEVYSHLKGETLVARHPSLRRSDIQKVQAVYKEELSHLTDVVVFSSKGRQPEAAKLQGGDYDGDTFWLCWDPQLTETFRNAPASFDLPAPETFGIQVDRQKVGEVIGPDGNPSTWLAQNLSFRLQDDMLGHVTKDHGRAAYTDLSLSSERVTLLADLHDLIIDSAKNGYTLTAADYERFKRDRLGIKQIMQNPAYEQLLNPSSAVSMGSDAQQPRLKWNPDHIIDSVLFEVVEPKIRWMEKRMDDFVKAAPTRDKDLEIMYRQAVEKGSSMLSSKNDGTVNTVLAKLKEDIRGVADHWKRYVNPNTVNKDRYTAATKQCYSMYISIQPSVTDHPVIEGWLQRGVSHESTRWELLKASAFYTERHTRHPQTKFLFMMAGRDLCYLKSHSGPGTRSIVGSIHATYKPRKERLSKRQKRETADDVSGSKEEEFYDCYEDWIDDLDEV